MRRILLVVLLGVAACAEVETIEPPQPPQLEGAVPAVGRRLDLEVEGRGTPVRLRGVTGRVTAVCVFGRAAAAGEGEDGGAARVLDACERVGARLADRIAVVGLTTDRDLDLDAMALRTYRDPGGEALEASLDLKERSQVVLVDQQGRVAEVLLPGELDRLEVAARRLVR